MNQKARTWERSYARKLLVTDTLIVFATVFAAQFLRFGFSQQELEIALTHSTDFAVTYTLLSLALCLGWLLVLAVGESRSPKVFGVGPLEYKRVFNLTLLTFGIFAIISYAMRAQIGRGYILLALPIGLVLLLVSRWLWRKQLHRGRRRRENIYRTLVVGDRAKSHHVASQIMGSHTNGLWIVGAVTERGTPLNLVRDIQVVADYDGLLEAVDELQIDTLIMTSADAIDPERMREIGWGLDEREVDLVVAAALTDIAGPRVHMSPVAGLPLIHVDYPRFSGRKRVIKRAFDILGSGALLLLLSPVFLIVALAVKTTSKGPIFYSQDRVGLAGSSFPMYKFRSMVQNADDQLQSLLDAQGTSDKPLHKIENDPRITPVGRFIRRYSLDELPQLLNVFLGHMSLVGPRPQREAEVALYARHHFRRLLVKPGVTGLWQVSGRSSLDWEDAIRLDLYYVENWSVTGDIVLLLRTLRAVVTADGAH